MKTIDLICSAFINSRAKQVEASLKWRDGSFKFGAQLLDSLLTLSIQNAGCLDLLLRSIEDEGHSSDDDNLYRCHYHTMIAGLWIGQVYEIFRIIVRRLKASEDIASLFNDLELIRIPLEKHELGKDNKLKEPMDFIKQPAHGNASDFYQYSKDDPKRAHIMTTGLSERHSVMWNVTDILKSEHYWLERRALSDRILSFF